MTQTKSSVLKRHCMVVHAYYPFGETRVQRQAEALIRQGYEVDVLCLWHKGDLAEEICNSVRVIRLPVQYKNHKWMGGKLLEYLKFALLAMVKLISLYPRQRYGTVQTHNLPDFLIFAAWFPKLCGARIILDLHDLMPEFFQGRYGRSKDSWIVRLVFWQEKLACRFADHVITVSELWRQALIKRGVPDHKCSVVMNVADHTVFHPPAGLLPDFCSDSLRLIYHGTITYRYGIDLVLKAMAKLRHQISNLHLTIHGGGEYHSNLVNLAQELDLSDQVRFSTDALPLNQLPVLIRSAHIGLAPYRTDVFTDGIVPTKLMEYAALGMPAIAARTTAIETYFKDTMVEFFTPGDADDLARCLLYLHQNRHRLAELAQGAASFNRRYNWQESSQGYVHLIEKLQPPAP